MKNDSPIAITGASGFLGAAVCQSFIMAGYRVRGLYYPKDSIAHLVHLDMTWHPVDITKKESVKSALDDVQAVIHVAGNCSFFPKEKQFQWMVNVEGTENILSVAKEFGIRKVVHVSTVNALGFPSEGDIGDERTNYNWHPYRIGYFESKYEAQKRALSYQSSSMDVIVVNPGTMFGPDDVNFNAASYVRALSKAPPLMFCPPGGTTVARVFNVAQGILLAYQNGRGGECYILGGEPLSYRELFQQILSLLHRRTLVIPLPQMILRLLAVASEAMAAIFKIRPLLTRDMVYGSGKKLFYSSQKAQRELSYDPGSVVQGIQESIDWYQSLTSSNSRKR